MSTHARASSIVHQRVEISTPWVSTNVWSFIRSSIRWQSTGAVASVVAIVVVVVAGARRTATAPDRYTASIGGNVDALVEQRSGQPLTDRIAALPGVKQIRAYTFVFGGLESARHKVPDNTITF